MNQMEQRHYSQELAEHTARQRDVVHQHQMEEGVSEGQTQKEESDKPSSQASGMNRQDNGESNVRTPPAVKGKHFIIILFYADHSVKV